MLPAALRAADALGLAREDGWHPGERGAGPVRRPRATRCRWTRPRELGEEELVRLFRARGDERQRVFAAADRLRREVCGDEVTYVVTRNIQYTNVCYFRCGFCAFSKGRLAANLRGAPYLVPLEEIVRRAREAWERGATEVCLQGGIHPAFTGDYYASRRRGDPHGAARPAHPRLLGARDLAGRGDARAPARRVPRRGCARSGSARCPGTAAEILDDEVRARHLPRQGDDRAVARGARGRARRRPAVERDDHVRPRRAAASTGRGICSGRGSSSERSGGFTEFVPLPFVHMEAPMWLQGRARSGPTFGETLLVHAVARLALHPEITNIQASWVKLGPEGVAAALRAGVNDLGGTLMNESISRSAGSEHGQEMPPEAMEALIRANGRTPRQRTTLYGEAPAERRAASFGAPPLAEPLNPPVRDAGLKAPPRLVRPGPARPRPLTAAAHDPRQAEQPARDPAACRS